jgi:hypothetical protein
LNLKCAILVSKFAFKFNLYRYALGLARAKMRVEELQRLEMEALRAFIGSIRTDTAKKPTLGRAKAPLQKFNLPPKVGLYKLNPVDP